MGLSHIFYLPRQPQQFSFEGKKIIADPRDQKSLVAQLRQEIYKSYLQKQMFENLKSFHYYEISSFHYYVPQTCQ